MSIDVSNAEEGGYFDILKCLVRAFRDEVSPDHFLDFEQMSIRNCNSDFRMISAIQINKCGTIKKIEIPKGKTISITFGEMAKVVTDALIALGG